ncbi:hypothetical protein B0H13DRAFT_2305960 [Mycena leptocephala]|nr:hypothetical protein B0H13DRAFT_2305960 [Mycena leptocephala]
MQRHINGLRVSTHNVSSYVSARCVPACEPERWKLTILDKGDGAAWNPPPPDLPSAAPSTPSKRARDPAVDSAFDDLSPSKKTGTA